MIRLYSILAAVALLWACDIPKMIGQEPDEPDTTGLSLTGTGDFNFSSYSPLSDKPVRIFYHIPEKAMSHSAALMVFHGAGRDAKESRDALIAKSNQFQVVIIVPEFSNEYYRGSDAYTLGNIFTDGDRPSAETLNPEEEWTFSIIDPLFDFFREKTGLVSDEYDVFGHSAGAQFAHRFLFFKPDARHKRVVSASAGWYTMPDQSINFPYGLKKSPLENSSLQAAFAAPLTVIVGLKDNDPNASSLRHNSQADAQGDDRLERAQYFYNQSLQLAQTANLDFGWKYQSLPNVDHDFNATSTAAANILYK